MARIGIIGAGPAGLALAHDLCRDGHRIAVFEAAPELGGLARSFELGPVRIERYYHFLCGDDQGYVRKLRELGLEDRLVWRATRMGFYYHGRHYPFASAFDLLRFRGIPLHGRLRYGLWVAWCSFVKSWRRLDAVCAEPWLVSLLGRETYRATWYPLLRVKFGEFHDRISAAWVWHRVRRVARSRKTLLHRERLGYLAGGTDTLIRALAGELERHGVEVRTGEGVAEVLTEDGRAKGLVTDAGEEHAFDYVVSAVPLPVFLRLVPGLGEEERRRLGEIDFLGVVCLTLRLREALTGDFWLNVNDPRIPFNGLIEYTNLHPDITGDGSKVVYVPYYLPVDHPRFRASDEELFAECVEALALIKPGFSRRDVLDHAVSRDPFAQVICPADFLQQVPSPQTGVRGLFLIESSQLYPADRTISGTIDLAADVARRIREENR